MPEKQKPTSEIVKKAAHFLEHPEEATSADVKSMAARLVDHQKMDGQKMDDQKNDPMPHKTAAKPKMKAAAAPAIQAAPISKAPKKSKAA
jgi:hypothetical protein